MRTKELVNDLLEGGTIPIRPPTPHKLKRLLDPINYRNFEDSKQDHHNQKSLVCLACRRQRSAGATTLNTWIKPTIQK